MRLNGKVAIITGGGSGIGAATALLFAGEGARVVVTDVNERGVREVANQITQHGGAATPVAMDVTQAVDCERMVKTTVNAYGKIDILFNNAGISVNTALGRRRGSIPEVSEEDWDRMIAVNLKGVYLCSKYTVPEMIKAGGGVIVHTASNYGFVGGGDDSYHASKGAVVSLTRAMAINLAQHNIRVNCVCPGPTDTPMVQSGGPDRRQMLIQKTPLGRLGRPEEIASCVLFLASDESSFVTGHALIADGGFIAQ